MQRLLVERRDPDLRAYWIWGPYLRGDSERSARDSARRYPAPGSVHYWTPMAKLAAELALLLRFPAGRLAWDVYLLYRRGSRWDLGFPEPTVWQHQLEIVQGEPLDPGALGAHVLAALRAR